MSDACGCGHDEPAGEDEQAGDLGGLEEAGDEAEGGVVGVVEVVEDEEEGSAGGCEGADEAEHQRVEALGGLGGRELGDGGLRAEQGGEGGDEVAGEGGDGAEGGEQVGAPGHEGGLGVGEAAADDRLEGGEEGGVGEVALGGVEGVLDLQATETERFWREVFLEELRRGERVDAGRTNESFGDSVDLIHRRGLQQALNRLAHLL